MDKMETRSEAVSSSVFPKFRPEARPFSPSKLSTSQKEALRSLIESMHAASLSAKRHRRESPTGVISDALDLARANHVLFVSGKRGTGKTSIMLSLMRELQERSRAGGKTPPLPPDLQNLDCLIDHLANNVIWLELIDMDPLPPPTNLLAALLTRIQKAVEMKIGPGERYKDDKPMFDLQQLQTDVALAWDGNLPERAQHLDPAQYAAEVYTAEEARLSLNSRLADTLEKLTLLTNPEDPQSTIFVFAVDDFDLNPERAFGLLRLIRTISIPRLFTILLGDLRIAEEMYNLVTKGGVRKLSGEPTSPGGQEYTSSTEIASNAMRKLLPPFQRITLDNLTINEALAFTPVPGSENPLSALMQGLPMRMSPPVMTKPRAESAGHKIDNFGDFFLVKDFATRSSYAYRAVELLHAPARHIADLWFALSKLHVDNPSLELSRREKRRSPDYKELLLRGLIDLFADWLQQAINEDPKVSTQGRSVLRNSLYMDPVHDEWEFHAEKTSIGCLVGVALVLGRVQTLRVLNNLECRVSVRRLRRWEIQPRETHVEAIHALSQSPYANHGPAAQPLAERTSAALMLFHDLLRLTGEGVVEPRLEDAQIANWSFAEWDVGTRETMRVPWFLPVWETFWEYGVFAGIWNRGKLTAREVHYASSNWNETELAIFLAYVWMTASIVVFYATEIDELLDLIRAGEGVDKTKPDISKWDWAKLTEIISQLALELETREAANEDDLRAVELRAWFINLAYILAPEAGVPDSIFDHLAILSRTHTVASIGHTTTDGQTKKRSLKDSPVARLWKRPDISREVALLRAQRLSENALTPLGLCLLSPALALHTLEGLDEGEVSKSDQVDVSLIRDYAPACEAHPVNRLSSSASSGEPTRAASHFDRISSEVGQLCPDRRMIRRSLPLRDEINEEYYPEFLVSYFYRL